ncbi:unnamed protein product [Closterium sp. Naga37s-1]|nr:unnamed protein product [Closterium sp. Naga37s-1]
MAPPDSVLSSHQFTFAHLLMLPHAVHCIPSPHPLPLYFPPPASVLPTLPPPLPTFGSPPPQLPHARTPQGGAQQQKHCEMDSESTQESPLPSLSPLLLPSAPTLPPHSYRMLSLADPTGRRTAAAALRNCCYMLPLGLAAVSRAPSPPSPPSPPSLPLHPFMPIRVSAHAISLLALPTPPICMHTPSLTSFPQPCSQYLRCLSLTHLIPHPSHPSPISSLTHLIPHPSHPSPISSLTHLIPHPSHPSPISSLTHLIPHPSHPSPISSLTHLIPHPSHPSPISSLTHLIPHPSHPSPISSLTHLIPHPSHLSPISSLTHLIPHPSHPSTFSLHTSFPPLTPTSFPPSLTVGCTTAPFLWENVLLTGAFTAAAVPFYRSPSSASARQLFRASLLFLPALMAAMLLHRLPHHPLPAHALSPAPAPALTHAPLPSHAPAVMAGAGESGVGGATAGEQGAREEVGQKAWGEAGARRAWEAAGSGERGESRRRASLPPVAYYSAAPFPFLPVPHYA